MGAINSDLRSKLGVLALTFSQGQDRHSAACGSLVAHIPLRVPDEVSKLRVAQRPVERSLGVVQFSFHRLHDSLVHDEFFLRKDRDGRVGELFGRLDVSCVQFV